MSTTPPDISPYIFDSVDVSEGVFILLPVLYLDIFDLIEVSEDVSAVVPTIFISIFDSIIVSEDLNIEQVYIIMIDENLIISEYFTSEYIIWGFQIPSSRPIGYMNDYKYQTRGGFENVNYLSRGLVEITDD